jgi:integrase
VSRYRPTRLANGRYKAIVDVGGREGERQRLTKTFDSEQAAVDWHALQKRRSPGDRRRTVLDAVDRYIERKRGMAPSYVNTMLWTRDTYVAKSWLGEVALDDLDVDQLERFYVEVARGKHRPARFAGQPASRSTVSKVHRLLRPALEGAKRAKWIATNPALDAELPDAFDKPRATAAEEYDLGDIARVLDASVQLSDSPYAGGKNAQRVLDLGVELADLVQIALATGARAGELAGLRWRDVGLVDGTVTFYGSISKPVRDSGRTGWVRKSTKTGKPRSMRIDDDAREALQARYSRQLERAREAGLDVGGLDRCAVFSLELERDYTSPAALGARWRRAVAKLDLDDDEPALRLHDLRHVNASEMRNGGVPDSAGMKRTGHASARMYADVYGHHRADSDDLATEVLRGTWRAVNGKRRSE